jgi:hypothetical protein
VPSAKPLALDHIALVSSDDDEEEEPPRAPAGGRTKQAQSAKLSIHQGCVKPAFGAAAPPAKKAKAGKIGGLTLEQHRRAIGDCVKHSIKVEKWCVDAKTHTEVDCTTEVFEALVVPNAHVVTPTPWSLATPVVVAQVAGGGPISEIFGASKIKGSTRMGGWCADKCDIIFYPPLGKMRIWWTMR